jgi:hypothetical protein
VLAPRRTGSADFRIAAATSVVQAANWEIEHPS